MVFCGRLSPACLNCRNRRLKCDLDPAGCSQCRRQGMTCVGYRDVFEIRIRDDTARTIRKGEQRRKAAAEAKNPSAKAIATASAQEQPVVSLKVSNVTQCDQRLDRFVFVTPMHDVAMAFFISDFIVATPFEIYLPGFCANDTVTDDACSSAVAAAAYAALARYHKDPRYTRASQRNYVQALSRLNSSIADPLKASQDRTIVAVFVLGLYETVVHRGGQSPTHWTAHTFGAFELLKLKDVQEFRSGLIAQLFIHLMRNIRTSCIQRAVEVPSEFLDFYEKIKSFLDPRDPSNVIMPITSIVAKLRARSVTYVDYDLLLEAAAADQVIQALSQQIEASNSQYTITCGGPPGTLAYEGHVHTYTSPGVAKMWNTIRLLRVFLHNFIVNGATGYIEVDFTSADQELTEPCRRVSVEQLKTYALDQLATLAADILASVDAFMDSGATNGRFLTSARGLVWPLTLIERVDWCPSSAKEHAAVYLERLAADLNMESFVRAAVVPDSQMDWLHMCHLG